MVSRFLPQEQRRDRLQASKRSAHGITSNEPPIWGIHRLSSDSEGEADSVEQEREVEAAKDVESTEEEDSEEQEVETEEESEEHESERIEDRKDEELSKNK